MGIPCSEVPTKNLINDWGVPKHYTSSVSETWGQIAVDEETGIVYVGTSAPAPNYNGTNRPGPNLFSSSISCINSTSPNEGGKFDNLIFSSVPAKLYLTFSLQLLFTLVLQILCKI